MTVYDELVAQSSCRTFHGTVSDEETADGRKQADRTDRWRYSYDR